jgi:hypothetical protein
MWRGHSCLPWDFEGDTIDIYFSSGSTKRDFVPLCGEITRLSACRSAISPSFLSKSPEMTRASRAIIGASRWRDGAKFVQQARFEQAWLIPPQNGLYKIFNGLGDPRRAMGRASAKNDLAFQ